ncbi:unnamed protein product [Pleuronectes platessa]|uniref:Uncharacterized protein n=1 Tax=Pleuronectes platessa TaxID=8262 RepID=A0A9N7YTT6_PLEPL|nr:unnamed protein product [Pleuronectes platessa]
MLVIGQRSSKIKKLEPRTTRAGPKEPRSTAENPHPASNSVLCLRILHELLCSFGSHWSCQAPVNGPPGRVWPRRVHTETRFRYLFRTFSSINTDLVRTREPYGDQSLVP